MAAGPSRPEELPALKALWKQAFGDEDAWIDLFFTQAYAPSGLYVLRDGGQVVSMAAWFPATLCQGRRGWPAAYLYAVATDRAHRGRGCCRQLLAYMEQVLPASGVECLCLVPGSDELFRFYEKLGYARSFTHTRRQLAALPAAGGKAVWAEPPEYLAAREEFLAGITYLSYPVPVLAFQQQAAALLGGGLLLLEDGDRTGCACAAPLPDGSALIHELLWPGTAEEGAALVCRTLGVTKAQVRTPGEGQVFAMHRWLREPPEVTGGYLGLAFD